MAQYKTPGVYIKEEDAFPNSVVEVPTGIPVFVGMTEKAERGVGQPIRISSIIEFHMIFGGAPASRVTYDSATNVVDIVADKEFFLYRSLQMFFANGGGACWILSLGSYGDAATITPQDFTKPFAPDAVMDKVEEPAIVVVPDALRFNAHRDDANRHVDTKTIYEQILIHCKRRQSRVLIMDVHNGYRDSEDDISKFREIQADDLSFGVAYYPWVHTNLVSAADFGLRQCTNEMIDHLVQEMNKDVPTASDPANPTPAEQQAQTEFQEAVNGVNGAQGAANIHTGEDRDPLEIAHTNALAISPHYAAAMAEGRRLLNRMPVAGAIAGVYARTDANFGVFKAPANTGIVTVVEPMVQISDARQERLNVPPNGKAINAIRTFQGRGTLIWGARTLDGNSNDWRYVNVRRTMLMLQQSTKTATQGYVFQSNVARTWVAVKGMIANFLDNQWKAGALAGATPQEAYRVLIGPREQTMTSQDILEGIMRVRVLVAMTRPAEFIEIKFMQKMQTS